MTTKQLIDSAVEHLHTAASVKTVYGQPVVRDDKTIIPVAGVAPSCRGGTGPNRQTGRRRCGRQSHCRAGRRGGDQPQGDQVRVVRPDEEPGRRSGGRLGARPRVRIPPRPAPPGRMSAPLDLGGSGGVKPARRRERAGEAVVPPIGVVPELDLAGVVTPRCKVDEVHGDRGAQAHPPLATERHSGLNRFHRPVR